MTGERLEALADVAILNQAELEYHRSLKSVMSDDRIVRFDTEWNEETLTKIYEARTIYIATHHLDDRLGRILSLDPSRMSIQRFIFHNTDDSVTRETVERILARFPRVHIYAEHLLALHPQAHVLPTGIANSMWKHGNLKVWAASRTMSRDVLVSLTSTLATNPDREHMLEVLAEDRFRFVQKFPRTDYRNYVRQLLRSQFSICPRGHGYDTHRLWECLYAGCVPIVKRDEFIEALRSNYPDLRLFIVEDWNGLNREKLVHYQSSLQGSSRTYHECMDMDYWRQVLTGCDVDSSSEIPFVFIHIGTEFFPTYVTNAIRQVRLWNPNSPIYFVSNEQNREKVPSTCAFVAVESLRVTPRHARFNERYHLDTQFRHGFNRYTSERLFVLDEFLDQHSIRKCVHLENDTMVYFDCRSIAPVVRSLPFKLYAPLLGNSHLTFGTVLVSDASEVSKLCAYLSDYLQKNEMYSAYCYFKESTETAVLPSCPDTAFRPKHADIIMQQNRVMQVETFGGIFDAAPLGQYIGGIDPRNGPSVPGYVNPLADYDVVSFQFKEEMLNGRKRWMLSYSGASYPIYALHIHSKQLQSFLSA